VTRLKRRAPNQPGIFYTGATTLTEATLSSGRSTAAPVMVAVLHPKGGVGRSTTVWHLGAELAQRGISVRIEDLDQGAHLTRVFDAHPLGLDNLRLGGNAPADLVIVDTAPRQTGRVRSTISGARTGHWCQ
jgi:Mrp family chromosome partitioning ATPase